MSKPSLTLVETMRVGLIQTDTNSKIAWKDAKSRKFQMDPHEAARCWSQIKVAFRQFSGSQALPDIILMPELAIPRYHLEAAKRFASKNGVILISGIDYTVDVPKELVRNQTVVIIPGSTKGIRRSGGGVTKLIGKIYAAPKELHAIQSAHYSFRGDNTIWLFDSARLGRFGVAICYDLMDLERALMYRTQIHHLFVLAYNQDIDTFYHVAEALCRTLYCNVVICNTGFHGGSLAVRPYRSTWNRVIYRHEGQKMDTSQIVELPVKAIDLAHKGTIGDDMKNLPPGFDITYKPILTLQKDLI